MQNFFKAFNKLISFFIICFIAIIALHATGIVDPLTFLDVNGDNNNSQFTSGSINSTAGYSVGSEDVSSALTIKLSGNYLTAFQKASKSVSKTDTKSLTLIKVGLQILQSKTIKYENALHFYSLDYANSGGTAKAKSYDLKNCINRINNGEKIYTDCFGFVRLVHSISCYTLNNYNPESVSGVSGLYGWKGAYSEGKDIVSINNLKTGAVIYDRKTGRDAGYSSTDRHVAIYLYTQDGEIAYMDQGGLKTGQFVNDGYIYSTASSTPYKFNKFKNYN